MSKFDDNFKDVNQFSGGFLVVTGKITKYEAGKLFSKYSRVSIHELEGKIKPDFVRFGFAPSNTEDYAGELCWYCGAKDVKGSMPVWIFKP